MDITILKKLGLTDKEIQIYLALLEYGAISVRSLAELTDLNRGTVYDILKKLQADGLASYYHHETKQKFVAEEPEKLLKLLEDKEKELIRIKSSFANIIPELKALQEKGGSKPTAKFYEGRSGIRFILDDLLHAMKAEKIKEYYIYSAEGVREEIFAAYPDFNNKRIKNKIKANTISLSAGGGTYGLDERKWLNIKTNSVPGMTYILIYADKCAFIAKDTQGNPVGVIIENKMIYETQKTIFWQLWQLL